MDRDARRARWLANHHKRLGTTPPAPAKKASKKKAAKKSED